MVSMMNSILMMVAYFYFILPSVSCISKNLPQVGSCSVGGLWKSCSRLSVDKPWFLTCKQSLVCVLWTSSDMWPVNKP